MGVVMITVPLNRHNKTISDVHQIKIGYCQVPLLMGTRGVR